MEIQYLTNAKGKKKAIVLPIKMYEKLLDKLDELEDIRLYNEAKKNEENYIPIDEVFKIIEGKRKNKMKNKDKEDIRLKDLEEVDLSQEEKDPTKMSKEEFFAMIDKRRKSKSIKMSMEDMQDLLVIMQRKDEPKSPFSEALERIKKYREKNLNTESR